VIHEVAPDESRRIPHAAAQQQSGRFEGASRDHDVAVSVVGNKVSDSADVDFLHAHVGTDLLGWVGTSRHVRAAERGEVRPIDELEPANRAVLSAMRGALDATGRDWARFTRQAVEFHLRNARAWANDRAGEDLTVQIDPDFILA